MRSEPKYDITVKTLAIIGLVCILGGMFSACGNQIGDGGNSTSDSNNDNSNTVVGAGEDISARCDTSFLWKPESESDGKLVILFEQGVFFSEVYAEDLEGNYETGRSAGFTNGGRLTIRFEKPGAEYSGRVIADECEFKVDEPGDRQE